MTNSGRKTGWVCRLFGKAIFGMLAACLLTNVACPQAEPQSSFDVTPRRLDLITPGTAIDKGPPKGWSHLIIKSQPRLGAGDVKQVSASTAQMCGLLYTAVLAHVEPEKTGGQVRHRLASVAVGLGTKIGDQDTIVSPEKQKALGANLSFLERIVLSKAQEKLQDVQFVARSDTMALIDAPGHVQREGRHYPIVLRYAVLADAATGQLETLLWTIDRDEHGGYKGMAGPMEWLPPNKLEDCVLHVDAREFSFGVPSENAFAMNRVPQGKKQLTLTDDLKPFAGRLRLSNEMAQQLEKGLRQALKDAAK